MSNSSIWPLDRTLSGATTLGQSGPESDGNEGVHLIPQSSKTEATSSGRLMSYPRHFCGGEVLPLHRDAFIVFYSPSWLGLYMCVRRIDMHVCVCVCVCVFIE